MDLDLLLIKKSEALLFAQSIAVNMKTFAFDIGSILCADRKILSDRS